MSAAEVISTLFGVLGSIGKSVMEACAGGKIHTVDDLSKAVQSAAEIHASAEALKASQRAKAAELLGSPS
jgi:hypothetical protein